LHGALLARDEEAIFLAGGVVALPPKEDGGSGKEERDRIETLNAENARLRDDAGAIALKKENATLKDELQRIRDTDPAKAQLQIEERDKTIAQRDKTIAARDETIAGQNKRIAELETQVKELSEKIDTLSQGTGRGPRRVGTGLGIPDRHGI
jgi:predicted RNase H-like nuclease (RuvC/YqgF family)